MVLDAETKRELDELLDAYERRHSVLRHDPSLRRRIMLRIWRYWYLFIWQWVERHRWRKMWRK